MIKHNHHYKQRSTKLDYLNKKYQLYCEQGVFLLYGESGELNAKSCRFPLHKVRNKVLSIHNSRQEEKFRIKEQSPGILVIFDQSSKIVHDYLVVEESAADYNTALFVFVCKALSYYGYAPKGKISMIPDQKDLSLSIDNGYLILQIENNAVIYVKGIESHYAKHTYKILDELQVKQYQRILNA